MALFILFDFHKKEKKKNGYVKWSQNKRSMTIVWNINMLFMNNDVDH